MSDFDFLDIEAELAGIRGRNLRPEKRTEKREVKVEPKQESRETSTVQVEQKRNHINIPTSNQNEPIAKPADLVVNQQPKRVVVESPIKEIPSNADREKVKTDFVGYKQFKTMPGIFEHVGGDRPVRLNPNIRKSQVSGIPEPMLCVTQKMLKEKYLGAVVDFPWGEYKVTEKNRVFTTKSSLLRYLLFDSLRDSEGTHVQYAKQWAVLQFPVFDETFNPDNHSGSMTDELDIYALLFVAHTHSKSEANTEPIAQRNTEQDYQTAERLGMINMGMTRILDKLAEQERVINDHMARTQITQTVMLLDRMGLLKGGLPKDIGELVRLLEQNRDTLSETASVIDNHVTAEEERQKTLARQERMRQMQLRGGSGPK